MRALSQDFDYPAFLGEGTKMFVKRPVTRAERVLLVLFGAIFIAVIWIIVIRVRGLSQSGSWHPLYGSTLTVQQPVPKTGMQGNTWGINTSALGGKRENALGKKMSCLRNRNAPLPESGTLGLPERGFSLRDFR